MASSFPSSLDTFTNPSSSDALDSVSVPHAGQHADLNDAVEALQAKVGADSSGVASSHDYKIAALEAGATGGKILQVVSTTKTDTFSASVAGGATTSVTGLTATITPSNAANKILVFATVSGSQETEYASMMAILTRGGTAIGVGDAAGVRTPINGGTVARLTNSADIAEATVLYLDAPASTSALTYGIDILSSSGSTRTMYVNRTVLDSNVEERPRSSSTIVLVEVSA
jgi:hypothetical protein